MKRRECVFLRLKGVQIYGSGQVWCPAALVADRGEALRLECDWWLLVSFQSPFHLRLDLRLCLGCGDLLTQLLLRMRVVIHVGCCGQTCHLRYVHPYQQILKVCLEMGTSGRIVQCCFQTQNHY